MQQNWNNFVPGSASHFKRWLRADHRCEVSEGIGRNWENSQQPQRTPGRNSGNGIRWSFSRRIQNQVWLWKAPERRAFRFDLQVRMDITLSKIVKQKWQRLNFKSGLEGGLVWPQRSSEIWAILPLKSTMEAGTTGWPKKGPSNCSKQNTIKLSIFETWLKRGSYSFFVPPVKF